jgi:hypothetical protein
MIASGYASRDDLQDNTIAPLFNFDYLGRLRTPGAQVGDIANGNYTESESDGTVVFHGNATVFEDENFSATVTAVGANAPALMNWDDSSVQVPYFTHTLTKELNMLKEYRHAGVVQGTISIHAHLKPTTADAGTMKFYVEYYIKHGTSTRETATLSAEVATNSAAWDDVRLTFPDLQSNLLGPGCQIGMRLYRLSTDPGTYTHPVAISTWGYHMELDMVGSHTISTK